MMRALIAALAVTLVGAVAQAHGSRDAITWNREISRVVYDKCASCHRPDGTAFSLMTYADAQPRATVIKDAVLARRMPPWGAVKGFGHFRNDQSLSQEQIELFTKWVDGGIRRGNNPGMLPKPPVFVRPVATPVPTSALRVSGTITLETAVRLDGLIPERVLPGQSVQIVAILPSGRIEPLAWLYGYDLRHRHPLLFRQVVQLPAGTVIRGVPPDAVVTFPLA